MAFKLNTVVNTYNQEEDMSDGVEQLNPVRWKVRLDIGLHSKGILFSPLVLYNKINIFTTKAKAAMNHEKGLMKVHLLFN